MRAVSTKLLLLLVIGALAAPGLQAAPKEARAVFAVG
jgi:hypothetical protein